MKKSYTIFFDDGEYCHTITVTGCAKPIQTGPHAVRIGRSVLTFGYMDVFDIREVKPTKPKPPEALSAERKKIVQSVVQMMAANAPYTKIIK